MLKKDKDKEATTVAKVPDVPEDVVVEDDDNEALYNEVASDLRISPKIVRLVVQLLDEKLNPKVEDEDLVKA